MYPFWFTKKSFYKKTLSTLVNFKTTLLPFFQFYCGIYLAEVTEI